MPKKGLADFLPSNIGDPKIVLATTVIGMEYYSAKNIFRHVTTTRLAYVQ